MQAFYVCFMKYFLALNSYILSIAIYFLTDIIYNDCERIVNYRKIFIILHDTLAS